MILIDDHIQDYTPEQIAQWLDELPQWRREQALAFKHDAGRRQSLLAYRLLCQGLREEYGITEPPTFVYGEHGKPHIIIKKNEKLKIKKSSSFTPRPSPPFFSLSHCREAVACVIDNLPCGIDIESPDRRITESLIQYAMNDDEQALIRQSDNPQRTFLRLWTQKEAVMKLTGTGIRDAMRDVLNDTPYHIETQETSRWIMSVASDGLRPIDN